MTKEDKELILKDLCARSFYSVMVTVPIMSFIKGQGPYTEPIELVSVNAVDMTCTVGDRYAQTSGIKMFDRKGELVCKPYLRPMSSMTEEEKQELERLINEKLNRNTDQEDNEWTPWVLYDTTGIRNSIGGERFYFDEMSFIYDWLNAHHFDYRGLIEKGLAIEAPEGMYI